MRGGAQFEHRSGRIRNATVYRVKFDSETNYICVGTAIVCHNNIPDCKPPASWLLERVENRPKIKVQN